MLMFALAWLMLPDLPAYRNGLVMIGLARCIAMVLIWNSLAGGSRELAAVLVGLNSVFQILTYSLLGYFFLSVAPVWLGGETAALDVSMGEIAKSVAVFLGVPLAAGYLTRRQLLRARGEQWYEDVFMRRLGPTALIGLLYTIVPMFAMQGDRIIQLPFDVLRIALPLLISDGPVDGVGQELNVGGVRSLEGDIVMSEPQALSFISGVLGLGEVEQIAGLEHGLNVRRVVLGGKV